MTNTPTTPPGGASGPLSIEQVEVLAYHLLGGDPLSPALGAHGGKPDAHDARGASKAKLWDAVVQGDRDQVPELAMPTLDDDGQVTYPPSIRTHVEKKSGTGTRPIDDPSLAKRIVVAHLRHEYGETLRSLLHPGQFGYILGHEVVRHCRVPGATNLDHPATYVFRQVREGVAAWVLLDLQDAFGNLPHRGFRLALERAGLPAVDLDLIEQVARIDAIEATDRKTRVRGEPGAGVEQGNAISADLLNVAVAEVFREIDRRGLAVPAAYADDMMFGFRSEEEAVQGFRVISNLLVEAGFPPPRPLGTEGKCSRIVDARRTPLVLFDAYVVTPEYIALTDERVQAMHNDPTSAFNIDRLRRLGHRDGSRRRAVRLFRAWSGHRAVTKLGLRHLGVLPWPTTSSLTLGVTVRSGASLKNTQAPESKGSGIPTVTRGVPLRPLGPSPGVPHALEQGGDGRRVPRPDACVEGDCVPDTDDEDVDRHDRTAADGHGQVHGYDQSANEEELPETPTKAQGGRHQDGDPGHGVDDRHDTRVRRAPSPECAGPGEVPVSSPGPDSPVIRAADLLATRRSDRQALKMAVEWGDLAKAPKIPWLEVPEAEFVFLDFAPARALLDAASEPMWGEMILVAVRTGLRLGELRALRAEDVDLKRKVLMVRKAAYKMKVGTPKTKASRREVPLCESAVKALKARLAAGHKLVFCNEDGSLLTKEQCKWPLWRACDRAGLDRMGWHVMRHTFASHLAMRGRTLKEIQELMGHTTIKMTLRYAHLSPEVKREAVAVLDED